MTPQDLIDRYLDGVASEGDLAELARRLHEPEVAAALADAAAFEAQLTAVVKARSSQAIVEGVVQQNQHTPVHTASPTRRSLPLRKRDMLGALAASLLVAACGLWVWQMQAPQLPGPQIHPATPAYPHRVLAGRLLVGGVEQAGFFDGDRLQASETALLAMADGSQAELTAQSTAIFRGSAGEDVATLELDTGAASIQAFKSPLRVTTPAGKVLARESNFSVALEGNLVVAVAAGSLEVEHSGEKYDVQLGESRVFAASPKTKPDVIGKLIKQAADGTLVVHDGKTQTIVHLAPETVVTYVNVGAEEDRPTPGQQAWVWWEDKAAGLAKAVELRRLNAEPKADVAGQVLEVAADGSVVLTVVKLKSTITKEKTLAVRIDSRTKVSYHLIPEAAQTPTVGYNALVWLDPQDAGRAQMVRFGGPQKAPLPKPVAKPTKPPGDKPMKPAGEKPAGDKPMGVKPTGDKPMGEKPSGEKPPADPHKLALGLLKKFDRDRDGSLSPDEVTHISAEEFKRADLNGDGVLDREELAHSGLVK